MAHRGWHYTKLSLSSALLFFSGMCFVLLMFLYFCRFCLVFVLFYLYALLGGLCRCSSDIFLSSRPRKYRYRNGYHIYYWVWLRPDRLIISDEEHNNSNIYIMVLSVLVSTLNLNHTR